MCLIACKHVSLRSEHWFTIRKVGGYWWNLNSTIDAPELVTDFYLSALLSSLRAGILYYVYYSAIIIPCYCI